MAHLVLLICVCCWTITPAFAQAPTPLSPASTAPLTAATPSPVPSLSTTTAFGLPLEPGDTISVIVSGEPQVTGYYTIREDGRIVFPMVGPLQVSGFTAMQLADRLTTALQKYVRWPVVAVDVVSAQPRAVTVLGDVPRPGTYDLRLAPNLHALLALAGEVSATADLPRAVVVREGEVTPLLKPGETQLPHLELHPGDVIAFPSRGEAVVHVVGAVRTPAAYALSSAGTAGRAILLAGNVLPEADPGAAYIVRGNQRITVDLSGVVAGGAGGTPDVPMEAGDMLIVPQRAEAYIYVLGEVRTAGAIPATTAPTVTAAIARAGGAISTGNLAASYILRQGTRVPVDLRALLQEGNAQGDQALQPGDVLVIPPFGGTVYLVGQVVRPGAVPYQQADTLMAAWSQAGGATPDGDLRNAMLVRGNEAIRVDLQALERGDLKQNLPLQAGDRLLVPRYAAQMYVLGQVGTPGIQNIHEGDTLLDVLARAGGPNAQASINRIALVRRIQPGEAEAERERVAAEASRDKSSGSDRVPAEKLREAIDRGLAIRFMDLARAQPGDEAFYARPGDLLFVPVLKQPRIDWLQVLVTLGTALLLGNR